MIIPVGIGSQLSRVYDRPGLGHVGSFIILIIGEVEHIDAVSQPGDEQDRHDDEHFPPRESGLGATQASESLAVRGIDVSSPREAGMGAATA